MAESSDQRLQDLQQRLQELVDSVREGVERHAPEVLDKLAATAKSIGQGLEDLASDARQREAEKEAAPESAGTSEPMPPEDVPPRIRGERRVADPTIEAPVEDQKSDPPPPLKPKP